MKQAMINRCVKHADRVKQAFPLAAPGVDAVTLCRRLRRLERALSLLVEKDYNRTISRAEFDREASAIMATVWRVLGKGSEAAVFLNTDPRGYALQVEDAAPQTAFLPRNGGGYGIIAPDLSEG